MKTKQLLVLIVSLMMMPLFSQTFQKNYETNAKHYHDINIAKPLLDGTDDFIVAANLLDSSSNATISLKRIDLNGNIVGSSTYTSAAFPKTRVFDIYTYSDLIFMTGSVDVSGKSKVFAARIEASSGNVLDLNYYDILSSNIESVGFHISYTERDADGDGVSDPGFIIGGTMGFCDPLDTNSSSCGVKEGFVLRVDFTLNQIWTTEIETVISGEPVDYDMVNHIIETDDGYFITGSAVGQHATSSNWQQAALAHKIDFLSVKQWDHSFIFGNAQDVSVDAYYDEISDEIYMLANYSVSHQFGVTVFENATGNVVTAKTWYALQADLNHYAFSIMESSNPDNLIITGYDRSETWISGGISKNSKTNLFVYEFEKSTGLQFGNSYQYLVEHNDMVTDPYNFWNGQMPLIYYPDINFNFEDAAGNTNYFHIGYKTRPTSADFTNSHIFKTESDKLNECENISLTFSQNPVTMQLLPNVDSLAGLTVTTVPFSMTNTSMSIAEDQCTSSLSTIENDLNKKIAIYPNPVLDYLNFDLENIQSYTVLDVLGRVVLSNSKITSQSIYLENLYKGIYILKLESTNNKVYTSKFIKQ
jgi:hypothetical protein